MARLRATRSIGLGFGATLLVVTMAGAQMPLPAAKPPDGTTLFKQQCATCHTINPADAVRQGPSLSGIVGRPAGKADGFRYSAGFTDANFVWDDTRLDAYLAKQNRYSTLQAEAMHARGEHFSWVRLVGSPLVRFFRFYLLRAGFLDGSAGLVHIAIGCFTSFCKYAKLRALERPADR